MSIQDVLTAGHLGETLQAVQPGNALETLSMAGTGVGHTRPGRFVFAAAGIEFLVLDFVAREQFSAPFEVELSLALEETYPIDEVLGSGGSLLVDLDDRERYFNGIVNHFVETGVRGAYRLFRARMVPQLWLLSLQQDCRIFQDKTVVDIISEVLETAGIPSDGYRFSTRNNYQQRPYCVQYRESHLDFISRLAEEEGIYYYFEHERRNHTIVFGEGTLAYQRLESDGPIAYHPLDQMVPEEEVVYEMAIAKQLQTSKVTLRDFDFERPSLNMTAETNHNNNNQRTYEWFDFPGRYKEPDLGQRFAAIRLQERIKNMETAVGRSNCSGFLPGYSFELECHDCDNANQEYTLVSVIHQGIQPQAIGERAGTSQGFSYDNRFSAIPARVAFAPLRKTPKPRIAGVQTAIVTGPRGEAIYTDEFGRVKVRFHWDRSDSHDEQSSCWIRVSQLWAGPNWGAMFLPRLGHEVIVEFEEGDPDKPIITGRVYHGAHMPPYDLPGERTKSTIKSDSIGGSGFNEIRFEDKGDEEEIFIHAQKDMNVVVENNRSHQVGSSDSLSVGGGRTVSVGGSETTTIGENRTANVQGNEQITVTGSHTKTIQQSEAINITGSRALNVNGVNMLQIKGVHSVTSNSKIALTGMGGVTIQGPTIEISADASIVLKVGSSMIQMTPMDIQLRAPIVITDAETVSSIASTTNNIHGMPVKINC